MRPKPVMSVRAWIGNAQVGADALVRRAERSSADFPAFFFAGLCPAGRVSEPAPTYSAMISAPALFSVVIDFPAASIHSCLATPFLIAVEITPVPIALV